MQEAEEQGARLPKILAVVLSLILLAAVLSPIRENWKDEPRDNFPLSFYPMFNRKRCETTWLTYIVGYDGDGRNIQVPYWFAGSGGFNQVRMQLTKIGRDRTEAQKPCDSIAEKIARSRSIKYRQIVSVKIIRGEFNLKNFFKKTQKPVKTRIVATCEVKRKK